MANPMERRAWWSSWVEPPPYYDEVEDEDEEECAPHTILDYDYDRYEWWKWEEEAEDG